MAQVVALHWTEQVLLDEQRLAAIVDELGERATASLLELVLEQLAASATSAVAAWQAQDLAATLRHADHAATLAEQVGLPDLSRVASMVGVTVRSPDHAAADATMARLMRMTNAAVTGVWDDPSALSPATS